MNFHDTGVEKWSDMSYYKSKVWAQPTTKDKYISENVLKHDSIEDNQKMKGKICFGYCFLGVSIIFWQRMNVFQYHGALFILQFDLENTKKQIRSQQADHY